MSLRRIAEGRIREAIEQGVFENLPGAGKPLDLEEYFNTPEDLRMAFRSSFSSVGPSARDSISRLR